MLALPGFRSLELLHRGRASTVARAMRAVDERAVVLKRTTDEFPSLELLAQFRHELELTRRAAGPGVVPVLEMVADHNGLALVFEDSGAVSLDQVLAQGRLEVTQALHIGVALAQALAGVHARGVVHKDVTPSNVLLHPQTGQVELIDFGIASALAREGQPTAPPAQMEGTLAYISPEQTGRMNRTVDRRTDLYSLGATLYHALVGRPPFAAADPMELIHAHLARSPAAPQALRPDIPLALSDIVLKLLSKNPEDRYASADGLLYDLRRAQELWRERGAGPSFALGQQDLPQNFEIPDRLYGRAAQVEQLLGAFDRTVNEGRTGLLLVTGRGGIGKSALVAELGQPLVARRGQFCVGKFDQLARSQPFSALLGAIDALLRGHLGDRDADLARLRTILLDALGSNGQVIVDVLPALEPIIGPQPALPALDPGPTLNRFRSVFQAFFSTLGSRDHPLVVFLDDLQWADAATLDLLEVLLQDDRQRGHLIIGAYRDTEVPADHPLSLCLARMQARQVAISTIALGDLSADDVRSMIGDATRGRAEPQAVSALAELVLEKTGGNPFFLREFLATLAERGHLLRDASGNWSWNTALIAELGITDNVVDLVTEHLQDLPDSTQRLLRLAACIGATFDLRDVARAAEVPVGAAMEQVWPAIGARLLAPVGHAYRRAAALAESGLDEPVSLRFEHDRIQQAAYESIPVAERAAAHASIGRLLLGALDGPGRHANCFVLLNHLNRATELLGAPERRELAALNHVAARRAMASAAYAPALGYAEVGIGLLGDAWKGPAYPMLHELHCMAAECAMLIAAYERMEELARVVDRRAHSELDRVPVWETRIRAFMARNRMVDAVRTASAILTRLGEPVPARAHTGHILWRLLHTRLAIGSRSIAQLPELPRMEDPLHLAVMRVLTAAAQPAYYVAPKLLPVLLLRMVQLSVLHGTSPLTPYAWVAYGHIQNLVFGNAAAALAYGRMGLEMHLRHGGADRAKLAFVFYAFIQHWTSHVRDTLQPLRDAYLAGLELGDYEYGAVAVHVACWHLIVAGDDLEKVEAEMRSFDSAIARMNQSRSARNAGLRCQLVLNLQGRAGAPDLLAGPDYVEATEKPALLAASDRTGLAQLLMSKCMLGYLFDSPQARAWADELDGYVEAVAGMVFLPLSRFYQALIYARCGQRWRARRALGELRRWSEHAPVNHAHRVALIEAELADGANRELLALTRYDQAIALARAGGWWLDEALALERAGASHARRQRTQMAASYLAEARHAWLRGRAHAKVADLDLRHPGLVQRAAPAAQGKASATTTDIPASIDVATILRSARAISGEIVLTRLLERIMRLALENAGAVHGVLLLPTDGELRVEAAGSADSGIEVLQSIALAQTDLVCPAIVNFVARSREAVVLADAHADGPFVHDAWVAARQSRSILCAPLVDQGQLSAVLFLENPLAADAFPPLRLEMLRLLSAQAAIAIDKARVYRRLEESLERQVRLSEAQARFVPVEFLSSLRRTTILDVELGENVRKEMSVLFSDIRGFTPLVEGMTPQEHIGFINQYLSYMEPPIIENAGFVDSYIGDAIMALFDGDPDQALRAGVGMSRALEQLNARRARVGTEPVRMGVGVNTGELTLGTIGGPNRIKCGVIGNPVNLAARIEGLTKTYGCFMLVSQHTVERLRQPLAWALREVGRVIVKGQTVPVRLYEVLDAEPLPLREQKLATAGDFANGLALYYGADFSASVSAFASCLQRCPIDAAAARLLEQARARAAMADSVPWDGVDHLEHK